MRTNIYFFWIGLSTLSCDSNLINDKNNEQEVEPNLCTTSIVETIPYPDSTDVYYRSDIQFELSEEDPNANIVLTSDGEVVSGNVRIDNQKIIFHPNTPLFPSTNYSASITYCGSPEPVSISFLTSELGTDVQGGVFALDGRSYAVDLNFGQVIQPTGVGDFLQTLLENQFLFDVQTIMTDEAAVRMALSRPESIEQNFCVPTIEESLIVNLREIPYFTLYGDTIPIIIAEYQLHLYDFETSGTINEQATKFERMYTQGTMDLREILPIMQDFNINAETVDEFSSYLSQLDVDIITCRDGEPYCMLIVVDSLFANEISERVQPVCFSNCHEQCESNLDTCTNPQENEECNE
jgi:hypothetical protein